MSRRVRQIPVTLDSKGITNLPLAEIKAILRAADELIFKGGRSLLAKILKGSRDKDVLQRGYEQCPVYGFFKELKLEEIMAKIDWLILDGYLEIEYDYRLPLIVYTPKGWEIEKDTYTDELLRGFDALLESGHTSFNMLYLKDRNRGMIHLLLDKVQATHDPRYIPILQAWEKIDYKKVQQRIRKVIASLS